MFWYLITDANSDHERWADEFRQRNAEEMVMNELKHAAAAAAQTGLNEPSLTTPLVSTTPTAAGSALADSCSAAAAASSAV